MQLEKINDQAQAFFNLMHDSTNLLQQDTIDSWNYLLHQY